MCFRQKLSSLGTRRQTTKKEGRSKDGDRQERADVKMLRECVFFVVEVSFVCVGGGGGGVLLMNRKGHDNFNFVNDT